MNGGGYFLTSFEVSIGQVVKHPASIAVHQVESAGEKEQALQYYILCVSLKEGLIAQHVKPCASINGLSLGPMVIWVGVLEGSLEGILTWSFVGVRLT